MKINKDAKFFFVVQPSKELMEKISNFIPFHSKCLNNLKHHLAMDEKTPKTLPVSTSRDHTAEVNIQSMLDLMEECDMLPTSPDNLGLLIISQIHQLLQNKPMICSIFTTLAKQSLKHM